MSWNLIAFSTLLAFVTSVVGCGSEEPVISPEPAAEQVATEKHAKQESNLQISVIVPEPSETSQKSNTTNQPSVETEEKTIPQAQPVFRQSDKRPQHDAARLKKFGIQEYSSKHLILYTDIEEKLAKPLPELIDRAYAAWVDYFGPLPPSRERAEFQMTAYLMDDQDRFQQAGLIPLELPTFINGRHRGQELWMNNQKHDYYRRHLLIHEATHCFMTIVKEEVDAPVWYLEGMAELFGTHRYLKDGNVQFRVMPDNQEDFVGFGRIRMLQEELKTAGGLSLDAVSELSANDFLDNICYAWSWALCEFLNANPRYAKKFQQLGRDQVTGTFANVFQEQFRTDLANLRAEWPFFIFNITAGFDFGRAAIDFETGDFVPADKEIPSQEITANRGWQPSGWLIEKGKTYRITASGRFRLAEKPKPWISEPQGISIRYHNGQPVGRLLATIQSSQAPTNAAQIHAPIIFAVGNELRFQATESGTIYFRLNDYWNELEDNLGTVSVRIQQETKQ